MIPAGIVRDDVERSVSARAGVPWKRIALWFALTRLALWIVAGLAIWLIPPGRFDLHKNPAEWLNHWDSGWYLSIARHGYAYHPGAKSNAAFFPLLPLLARGLSTVVPNMLVSGYIITNAFLFGSCVLLWKLVVRDYGGIALANRAVWLLLLCPVTIFFSSFFTESLFLFFAMGVAYLAGAGRWLGAGACGFFAALTRPPGALLVVLIAVEYGMLLARRRRDPALLRVFVPNEAFRFVVGMLLPPCALVGFACYLYEKFGDAKIMFHVHEAWHQHMVPPWYVFISGFGYDPFYIVEFYFALIVACALTVLGFRWKMRPSHLAMLGVFLFLYSTNSLMEAIPRYLSVLFPLYILGAEVILRHPRWERVAYGASAALATLSIALFADAYWFS